MHEYRTARTIFGFMEFGSWCMVVGGAIMTLAGMAGGGSLLGSGGGLLGAIPGLIIIFFGIFGVMMVQIGRAAVDTAQMTGKLLENSNEELRILKARPAPSLAAASLPESASPKIEQPKPVNDRSQSAFPEPKPAQRVEPIPVPTKPAPPPEPPKPKALEHLGRRIEPSGEGWRVGKVHFASVDEAKSMIEATTLRAER